MSIQLLLGNWKMKCHALAITQLQTLWTFMHQQCKTSEITTCHLKAYMHVTCIMFLSFLQSIEKTKKRTFVPSILFALLHIPFLIEIIILYKPLGPSYKLTEYRSTLPKEQLSGKECDCPWWLSLMIVLEWCRCFVEVVSILHWHYCNGGMLLC